MIEYFVAPRAQHGITATTTTTTTTTTTIVVIVVIMLMSLLAVLCAGTPSLTLLRTCG